MKITNSIIETAYKLATNGLNNKDIYEALNISKSAFYSNMHLMDSIKKARADLRESIASSILDKSINTKDTTMLIFLAKRLNLFTNEFNIDLSTPTEAIKSLNDVANANIPIEHKNSLRAIISDYFKSYEVVELEQRVNALEERYIS